MSTGLAEIPIELQSIVLQFVFDQYLPPKAPTNADGEKKAFSDIESEIEFNPKGSEKLDSTAQEIFSVAVLRWARSLLEQRQKLLLVQHSWTSLVIALSPSLFRSLFLWTYTWGHGSEYEEDSLLTLRSHTPEISSASLPFSLSAVDRAVQTTPYQVLWKRLRKGRYLLAHNKGVWSTESLKIRLKNVGFAHIDSLALAESDPFPHRPTMWKNDYQPPEEPPIQDLEKARQVKEKAQMDLRNKLRGYDAIIFGTDYGWAWRAYGEICGDEFVRLAREEGVGMILTVYTGCSWIETPRGLWKAENLNPIIPRVYRNNVDGSQADGVWKIVRIPDAHRNHFVFTHWTRSPSVLLQGDRGITVALGSVNPQGILLAEMLESEEGEEWRKGMEEGASKRVPLLVEMRKYTGKILSINTQMRDATAWMMGNLLLYANTRIA